MTERKPGASARLMNKGLMLYGVEDRFQGIVDRQHEAGRELLKRTSGVHEGRRIWKKRQGRHGLVELVGQTASVRRWFDRGDIVGDTVKQCSRRFDDDPAVVLGQVPPAQDRECIGRQSWGVVSGTHGEIRFIIALSMEMGHPVKD